ncbi:hypothetical protein [Thiomicrorhabdus chilensis]|uniref:hypothetical protein n=1 Tax=Thiomicrorhabdus chilensis TaxID=63656 RepID=UPI0004061DF0|nr:hypothetical protein [Thiomicrorhabdus chilensis]
MKKLVTAAAMGSALVMANTVQAASVEGLGIGAGYGLFSGPTLELNYPINDVLQVRGALSAGMGINETTSDTEIEYDVKLDGGINRLALDYHPFGGAFFLSAGYAVNNFNVKANAHEQSEFVVGDNTYNGNVYLDGQIDWDSAPTLSLGWGHSPAQGWGAMVELGAIFTGSGQVDLNATGNVNGTDVTQDSDFQADLIREEKKLQDDVGDYDFLPILQAGVTYRF